MNSFFFGNQEYSNGKRTRFEKSLKSWEHDKFYTRSFSTCNHLIFSEFPRHQISERTWIKTRKNLPRMQTTCWKGKKKPLVIWTVLRLEHYFLLWFVNDGLHILWFGSESVCEACFMYTFGWKSRGLPLHRFINLQHQLIGFKRIRQIQSSAVVSSWLSK